MEASLCACNSINVTQYTSSQSFLLLRKATCFNKYEKNAVYQFECLTCHKIYIGQNGRPFRVRYSEHYNDFKYSNNRSTFDQHIVNQGHCFGPMKEIINVIHFERKEKLLNILEKCLHLQRDQKRKSDKRQTYRAEQSNIRNNSETVFSKRAALIKSSRDANARHPQRQYTRAVMLKPAQ